MKKIKLDTPFYLNISIWESGKATTWDDKFIGATRENIAVMMREKRVKKAKREQWGNHWQNPKNHKTVKITHVWVKE